MKNLSLEICEDRDECEKIWRSLVVPQCLWDEWEIRKIFVDVYQYPLNFVLARKRGRLVGVLPLWKNLKFKRWEWISDQWAEGNTPLASDRVVVETMLRSLHGKVFLDAIRADKAGLFGGTIKRDANHFGFSIKDRGGDWDGIAESLPQRRTNVKRNIKFVERLKPYIYFDRAQDIEKLFDLNIKRMREKVDKYDDEELSVYEDGEINQKVIREFWARSGGKYRARIISIEVAGQIVSVHFNLIWKDKYVQLHRGEDVMAVSGIGSFANKLVVEDAKKHDCDYVDFCMEDHHWKRDWCDPDPTYKYEKNNGHI